MNELNDKYIKDVADGIPDMASGISCVMTYGFDIWIYNSSQGT